MLPLLRLLQALFGDRYGNAAMMRSISEDQFHNFKKISEIMKVKHAELLDEWYELDNNALPPCYSLKASASTTPVNSYWGEGWHSSGIWGRTPKALSSVEVFLKYGVQITDLLNILSRLITSN